LKRGWISASIIIAVVFLSHSRRRLQHHQREEEADDGRWRRLTGRPSQSVSQCGFEVKQLEQQAGTPGVAPWYIPFCAIYDIGV
jgi:hypothetical protein